MEKSVKKATKKVEDIKVEEAKKHNIEVPAKTKNEKTLDEVVIKNVSSPATLKHVAEEKSLNPQEVFVRVTFEHEGKTFTASNKLKYLRKEGYQELLDAKQTGKPICLTVDIDNGFFYIEKNVTVDDLFKDIPEEADTRSKLTELL